MEKLCFETMKNYQSFATIEEMDQSVRGFLYVNKSSLSDGTLKVLHFIWRHSVKVAGVSFAKYDTIAKEIGVSRRTVIRAVNQLEQLHFLKRVPTVRLNGKQGVNLLVLQPFEPIDQLMNKVSPQHVTPPVTPIKAKNKQGSLCENKQKRSIDRLENVRLDTTFLPDSVHPDFIRAAKPFFHAEDIYKLWNRAVIAYEKSMVTQPLEALVQLVERAFKQTIFMAKMGKIHTSIEGYFYRVCYANFLSYQRKAAAHFSLEVFAEILNEDG